ncbi:Transcription factor [Schizosaccharomyces pombe]
MDLNTLPFHSINSVNVSSAPTVNERSYPFLLDASAGVSGFNPVVSSPEKKARMKYKKNSTSPNMDVKSRKKVSRACDFCRQKKIRCDMDQSPRPGNACINCRKHHLDCNFTRTPLKRGPAKGFNRNADEKQKRASGSAKSSSPAVNGSVFSGNEASPSSRAPSITPVDSVNTTTSAMQVPSVTLTAPAPLGVDQKISQDQKPDSWLTYNAQFAQNSPQLAPSIPSPMKLSPANQQAMPPYPQMLGPGSISSYTNSNLGPSAGFRPPTFFSSPSPQPYSGPILASTAPTLDGSYLSNPSNSNPAVMSLSSNFPSPPKPNNPVYLPPRGNPTVNDRVSNVLPSITSFDSSVTTVPSNSPATLNSYTTTVPSGMSRHPMLMNPSTPEPSLGVNSPSLRPLQSLNNVQNSYRVASTQAPPPHPLRNYTSDAESISMRSKSTQASDAATFREVEQLYQENVEWDDAAIDRYYLLIHSTLPILHHSKARLKSELEKAPINLRSSCLHAIYSLVNRPPFATLGHVFHNTPMKAIGLLNLICSNVQDLSNRILHLQTMILLAIESDQRGPTTITGRNGLPQGMWLGAAIGLACNMRLHIQSHLSLQSINEDMDSDEALCRRAWWVLVVLDRWHSMSTCSPLFLPETFINLTIQDQKLLGTFPSQLVRLSLIVGHISDVFQSPDPTDRQSPIVTQQLRSEIDAFRQSVDVVWGQMNLLTLAVTHVKVLLELCINARPSTVLVPAMKMATILSSSSTPMTPLNHHFFSLATCVLIGVFDLPELQNEARRGLEHIRECIEKRRDIVSREDHEDWDYIVLKLINAKMQGMPINSDPSIPPHVPPSSAFAYSNQEMDSATFKDAYLYTRLCNLGYLGFLI